MLLPTTIRVNGKELKIGQFDTEIGRWIIKRDRNKHFHRKMKAWGLDYQMYEYLKKTYGLSDVVIYDMKLKPQSWTIKYKDIEKNKIFKEFKPHRKQIFIAEKYWNKS
jgi:hypothetical protein